MTVSQTPDPNQPDPLQPGYAPPPRPLDYQTPKPSFWGAYNRWWMVLLRVLGGMVLAVISMGTGIWLADLTNVVWLIGVPPLIVLAVLLFVCIRYRRFGYVTGFLSIIIAMFLVVAVLIALIIMICGK